MQIRETESVMPNVNTKMSVVLKPEQIAKLRAYAEERELSMSDVVREIVRGYASQIDEKPSKRVPKKKARR